MDRKELARKRVYNWGQKPCYKCGSPARVRAVKHEYLDEVYNVCCTNPDCGNVTSRNYVWRDSAVKAWNNMPTISNLILDFLWKRLEPLIDSMVEKSKTKKEKK